MLLCNLSVLLSERGLKITKVSKDTGISRTTLTALCQNKGAGIQFDTINKLCKYLKIAPDQLFIFYPIELDFEFLDTYFENDFFAIELIVSCDVLNTPIPLHCHIEIKGSIDINDTYIDEFEYITDITFSYEPTWEYNSYETIAEDEYYCNKKFYSIWCDMPIQLRNEFENKIISKIIEISKKELKEIDEYENFKFDKDCYYNYIGSCIPTIKPYIEKFETNRHYSLHELTSMHKELREKLKKQNQKDDPTE